MTRLRKEYLYRRSLQGKEREIYEKKRKIREALREGKPIPTELRNDVDLLKEELEFDDMKAELYPNFLDDEYARGGTYDPKVMLTTSREPSPKLTQFVKELKLVIPGAEKLNRGKHIIGDLVDACRRNGVTDLIIVHETRGQPDGLIVSHLPYGPTAYFALLNVLTRHDIGDLGTMPLQSPHLIFHNFNTKLGMRVTNILKYLFPPGTKEDSRRIVTFANNNDFISFRHHVYKKIGHKEIDLVELGPRFEMHLYQIKLGTVDMHEAETEWVLRPYMNTAKKRKAL